MQRYAIYVGDPIEAKRYGNPYLYVKITSLIYTFATAFIFFAL